MARASIIDYYSILNLPPTADLMGIENAYGRLSEEFAAGTVNDETSGLALERLNEAYSVLSRPTLRRDYDRVYFSNEIQRERFRRDSDVQRRTRMRQVLIGSLLAIVLAQGLALAYVARGEVGDAVHAVFAPLLPGTAN